MSGRSSAVSALPKSATALSSPRAEIIASSSTATASCGPTSSPCTGVSPKPDGSSPATACCCRRRLTAAVLRDGLQPESWTFADWVAQRARGGVNRLAALLRLPLGPLRKLEAGKWEGARSCNLAVWRRDLDQVDGFDASFQGWGREDSDLLVRLLHAGVRRKDGRFATGVVHLWHAPADRAQLNANDAKLDAVLRSARIRADSGLSQLRAMPPGPR